MEPEQPRYTRLPSTGWIRSSLMTTLWLGDDHLLQETRFGTTHLYHRFYYRDIHGLIIRRTATGPVVNGILLAGMAILALIMVGVGALTALWLILIAIVAALLLWNIARGPTCTCYLQTAVHVRHLPSLGRVKTAIAALAILQPRVTEAQGGPSPEEIRAAAPSGAPTLTPVEAAEPPLPPPVPPGGA